MSFLTKITITNPGSTLTNFNIYQASDGFAEAVLNATGGTATGVTKADLVSGYLVSLDDANLTIPEKQVLLIAQGTCSTTQYFTISGLPITPTPTPTPTATPIVAPPNMTLIYLSSGTTIANACTGATQAYYYVTSGGFTNGIILYTTSDMANVAPGSPGFTKYYYSSDYNTIYYIDGGEGKKYASASQCPTPTPTTGTVINAVFSLADAVDACAGGDEAYGFNTLTVYGSNIQNASGIINIPNPFNADINVGDYFWVRAIYSHNLYVHKFQKTGSNSATSVENAVLCSAV